MAHRNCQTLFGIGEIPTDNHIRVLLDEVSPAHLEPCFDQALEALRQGGGLGAFERLDGRTLIALDGTESSIFSGDLKALVFAYPRRCGAIRLMNSRELMILVFFQNTGKCF